jgi:hypothetical protein
MENEFQDSSVIETQTTTTTGAELLSAADINVRTRNRKGAFMYFDNTAKELASLTFAQLTRIARRDRIKLTITEQHLKGYYGRLLILRLQNVIKSLPGDLVDDSCLTLLNKKAIPKGNSPKYVRMFDIAHTIINLIGYVELSTPRMFIVPTLQDVESMFKDCTDASFSKVETELSYFGAEFGNLFPVRQGIDTDPSGDEQFMKVSIIDQFVMSLDKDVNPVTIAYAALSNHNIHTDYDIVYGWEHGLLSEYTSIVKSNIYGR